MISIFAFLENPKTKSILRESWALSWPMAIIMLYEFFIGIADVYVAGRFGPTAQAAYGFAFQLYFIFILIGIALSIGVVSVIARLYASEKKREFNIAINSALALVSASGLVFGLGGLFFSRDIVGLMSLPAEIKGPAAQFMRIYSLAFLFDYILMSANGILRSCGMVRRSLWIMSVVCVMNIALNFILALGTPLGVNGIAVATAISLAFGAVAGLYFIKKMSPGRGFSFSVSREILRISWPSGLLQAFWQFASLALFLILSMLPLHNVEIMAALTNGLKTESAIFLPAFAFNMANAVVVGNLLGKRQNEDAFRGGIVTALLGVAVVSVLTVVVMVNARFIASFLSNNPVVINESMKYIYIALLAEPVMAWGVILGGGLNGAGDTKSVMIISATSTWLVRIPLAYILGIQCAFGATAIWWAMNASIVVQSTLITRRYFNKRWIAAAERTIAA